MKKILIVDDERALCELMAHILKGRNYEVAMAFNGIEGLEKARSFAPDLIVLDVSMPQMDGWQLLRGLKASPKTENIRVIMCTEHNLIRDLEQAETLGAHAYIFKPFTPERVIKKVEEVLGGP